MKEHNECRFHAIITSSLDMTNLGKYVNTYLMDWYKLSYRDTFIDEFLYCSTIIHLIFVVESEISQQFLDGFNDI